MPSEQNREKQSNSPATRTASTTGNRATGRRSYIRLNSDENPYCCSLNVLEALGSCEDYYLPADPVIGKDEIAATDGVTRQAK